MGTTRVLLTGISTLLSLLLAVMPAQASLESEQAILSQLNQTLDDAKSSLKNIDFDISDAKQKADEEQKAVDEATAERDQASTDLESAKIEHTASPNTKTERRLQDAEYAVMMAERKLSSASKSLARAHKKLDESRDEQKELKAQISKTEAAIAEQKALVDKVKASTSEEAQRQAAEEKARQEEEARLAAEQAAAEAAQKAEQAAAAAKKEKLKKELGIDLSNCVPLPDEPATTGLSDVDAQVLPYAQGELRRINRLIESKPENDAPPLNPAPILTGSKLKPCDPNKWAALKFSYLGNGQYRLETPVTSGEQSFEVKNIVAPIRRIIPDTDNGVTYVFFLDVKYEGRYKLSTYKKQLFGQATQ